MFGLQFHEQSQQIAGVRGDSVMTVALHLGNDFSLTRDVLFAQRNVCFSSR
jgi:hypothetical protein